MVSDSLVNKSRMKYTSDLDTLEVIRTGSLQRIADATELMAKGHTELQRDKDNYQRWYREEKAKSEKLYLRIAALKGVITKLNKKQKEAADKAEEAALTITTLRLLIGASNAD